MSEEESQTANGRPEENDVPDIPSGNTGPLPGWPLWVSAALWAGWMVFLAVTALAA